MESGIIELMDIRFAKQTDIKTLITLARVITSEHHTYDVYYRTGESYSDTELSTIFEDDLKDENTAIIVAEENHQIIGFIKGLVEEAPIYAIPKIKKLGKIGMVIVRKECRKKGAAKLLIQKLEEWFKRKKLTRVELNVDIRNSDAIAAWKKMGFTDYQMRMAKSLENT